MDDVVRAKNRDQCYSFNKQNFSLLRKEADKGASFCFPGLAEASETTLYMWGTDTGIKSRDKRLFYREGFDLVAKEEPEKGGLSLKSNAEGGSREFGHCEDVRAATE